MELVFNHSKLGSGGGKNLIRIEIECNVIRRLDLEAELRSSDNGCKRLRTVPTPVVLSPAFMLD